MNEKRAILGEDPTTKKEGSYFARIETKEEALSIVKKTSNIFYFLAVLQTLVGFLFWGTSSILDVVIFASTAFLLRKYNSRGIALFMVIISAVLMYSTATCKVNDCLGGKNVFLTVIMLWASVRALQATIKIYQIRHN